MKLTDTVKVFKRSIFKFDTQRAINISVNVINTGLYLKGVWVIPPPALTSGPHKILASLS